VVAKLSEDARNLGKSPSGLGCNQAFRYGIQFVSLGLNFSFGFTMQFLNSLKQLLGCCRNGLLCLSCTRSVLPERLMLYFRYCVEIMYWCFVCDSGTWVLTSLHVVTLRRGKWWLVWLKTQNGELPS